MGRILTNPFLQTDTVRLIYAYGLTDPSDNDFSPRDYHSPGRRGSKSVYLLDPEPAVHSLPEDTLIIDMTATDVMGTAPFLPSSISLCHSPPFSTSVFRSPFPCPITSTFPFSPLRPLPAPSLPLSLDITTFSCACFRFFTFYAMLQYKLPSDDTTYYCSFHDAPQLDSKHHIVAVSIVFNWSTCSSLSHLLCVGIRTLTVRTACGLESLS